MIRFPLAERIALIVTLAALVVSCQSPQEQAKLELQQEIERREQTYNESMQIYQRGMILFEQGELAPAARLFRGATDVYRRNPHAWMSLGLASYELGQLHEAAQAFQQAARLEPKRFEPRFNQGCVLESLGRYSQAIDEYSAALAMSPDSTEVMEHLSRCYLETGTKTAEAKSLVARALRQEYRPEWRRWLREASAKLEDPQETGEVEESKEDKDE